MWMVFPSAAAATMLGFGKHKFFVCNILQKFHFLLLLHMLLAYALHGFA
jgi:hypothetical protein